MKLQSILRESNQRKEFKMRDGSKAGGMLEWRGMVDHGGAKGPCEMNAPGEELLRLQREIRRSDRLTGSVVPTAKRTN